jgi:hypothetical protein
MRLFSLFKSKDQTPGLSELRHMHELLDLPGLLAALSKVDSKFLANALDMVLDICTNNPAIVRMHLTDLVQPVMNASIGDDIAVQDRWLELSIKLIQLGLMDRMMDQGLPERVAVLLQMNRPPDWRLAYLAMEVSRSRSSASITSDGCLIALLRALETGEPKVRQYSAAALEALFNTMGADPFLRLGAQERFRTSLLDPDRYVADTARSMLARCEVRSTVHDRMGSMVQDSSPISAEEEATATEGKKQEEGKDANGGYYRPGSRTGARARVNVKKVVDDDVVEDMNLRRRKVDDRFEVEKKAALAVEAENVYTGHVQKKKDDDDDEDFVIEEE